MGSLALSVVAYIRAFFVPRHQLALEAAAVRQQLAVFKRKQTRLRLHRLDRFFWTALRRVNWGWTEALMRVEGPNGFERSYTLAGSFGEHEPGAVRRLILQLIQARSV